MRGSVKRLSVGLAALVGLAAVGCGPVEYLNQVTRRASTALAAAEEVDAEKLAPYEYYTSKEFLHKARELGGYSRYQLAIEYGRKAEEAALKARAISLEQKAQTATPEPPQPVAPTQPQEPSAQ